MSGYEIRYWRANQAFHEQPFSADKVLYFPWAHVGLFARAGYQIMTSHKHRGYPWEYSLIHPDGRYIFIASLEVAKAREESSDRWVIERGR